MPLSDDFESYSVGTDLHNTSAWNTAQVSGSGVMRIDTHTDHKAGKVVDMSTTGVQNAIYQTQVGGNDHEVQIASFPDTLAFDTGTCESGVLLRCQDSDPDTPSGYYVQWHRNGDALTSTLRIYRLDAGSLTQLAASGDLDGTYGIASVHTIKGAIDGSVITAYVNSNQELTYDTSGDGTVYSTGQWVGVRQARQYVSNGVNAQPFFDDFAADTIGGSATDLVVQEATHGHTADAPALTQVHNLTTQEAAHAHTADAPALTQQHSLTVADATHGHAADSPTLTSEVTLSVAEATHAHAAEAPGLTQQHALTVAEGTHAHAAESPTLVQQHALVVQESTHGHTADSPTVTTGASSYALNGTYVESPAEVGPFSDANGNLYFLNELAEATPNVRMRKSTDGGQTWTVADSGNEPTQTDWESADIQQVGTDLHIVVNEGGSVTYHRFATSDAVSGADTWTVKDETVISGISIGTGQQTAAVVVRSDGTVACFYNRQDTSDRLFYKIRSSGGTWGSEQNFEVEAGYNWHSVVAIRGASDKAHIFYKGENGSVGPLYHRSLSSVDVLSAREAIDSNTGTSNADDWPMAGAVYWDDGGTEKVMVVYGDSDDLLYSSLVTNDGTPATPRQVSATVVRKGAGTFNSRQPVATVHNQGSTVHVVYADSTTADLWRVESTNDGAWSSATEVQDAVDVYMVRGRVVVHGGNYVFGYVFDESSTGGDNAARYSEFVLGAAATNLVVQEASHAHAAESPSLTQAHALTAQDSTHAHTADSPALTQLHVLTVQEATHAHTADAPTLSVEGSLSVQEATHAHSADSPALVQQHALTVAEASHAHAADNVDLSGAANLAPADSTHGHTADAPALTQDHVLAPLGASHGHAAEAPALTQAHELVVQESTHAHAAESPAINTATTLTVADATHGHAADAPVLTQLHVLAVDAATHAHAADSLALTQLHSLAVLSATHAHSADSLVLSLGALGEVVAGPTRVTVQGTATTVTVQGTATTVST